MTGSSRARARGERRRIFNAWGVLGVAYVALIFFVSSRPYLHAPGPEFDMKDKVAHCLEYSILGALLASSFLRRATRELVVTFLLVVAIGAGIAAADEMFQGTVPGRQRDVADWIADVTGIALASGLVLWLTRHRAPSEDDQR